jgi:hypothetical protein
MNAGEKQGMSTADAALQARLRLIGVSILAAGLLAAAAVTLTAPPDDGASLPETKVQDYQMEYIAGKSNELATEIREWVASLWHGRRLAQTLTFLSVGGSLSCFFLAHRLNYSPAPRERDDGGDG